MKSGCSAVPQLLGPLSPSPVARGVPLSQKCPAVAFPHFPPTKILRGKNVMVILSHKGLIRFVDNPNRFILIVLAFSGGLSFLFSVLFPALSLECTVLYRYLL